jgi:hypothetical protein
MRTGRTKVIWDSKGTSLNPQDLITMEKLLR